MTYKLDVAGNLTNKGRIVGHFHSVPELNGQYIAYLPGKRDEAIKVLHGPTFKSANEVAALLGISE